MNRSGCLSTLCPQLSNLGVSYWFIAESFTHNPQRCPITPQSNRIPVSSDPPTENAYQYPPVSNNIPEGSRPHRNGWVSWSKNSKTSKKLVRVRSSLHVCELAAQLTCRPMPTPTADPRCHFKWRSRNPLNDFFAYTPCSMLPDRANLEALSPNHQTRKDAHDR